MSKGKKTVSADFLAEMLNQAGTELTKRFHSKLTIFTKSDESIVTDADLASEKVILDRIRNYYGDDIIYSEESGLSSKQRKEGQGIWIIDPLDGTSNFANGYGYFCVSIGRGVFTKDLGIELTHGGIIDPIHNKLFLAQKGKGATCNSRKIKVTEPRDLAKCFLVTGFYYLKDDALAQQIHRFLNVARSCTTIRRDGAAALDLALVAEGVFDGFWEYGLQPWDVAAGSLLVQEAGGAVRNYKGEGFAIDGEGIVAGNNPTVDRLIDLVA